MSDLPMVNGPINLSRSDRRRAAIKVAESTGYDRVQTVDFLLMLGLIRSTENGYAATEDPDSGVWDIQALTTVWK